MDQSPRATSTIGVAPPYPAGSMTRRFVLGITALLVPLSMRAQMPAAAAGDTSTVLAFRFFAKHYGDWLVAAFDSIPASKYSFSPTPAQQTIAHIAHHVEDANYGLCGRLGTMTHDETAKDGLPDSVKDRWPKDTLVARLRESLAFCDSAMSKLDDAKLEQQVAFGTPSANLRELPSRALLGLVADLAEHYSQVASYMRAMGMIPSSALGSSGGRSHCPPMHCGRSLGLMISPPALGRMRRASSSISHSRTARCGSRPAAEPAFASGHHRQRSSS